MLFVTGMTNIRDVIPFPRTPNNADFDFTTLISTENRKQRY